MFLLTGSVILPLKAVLMNIMSLTAAFGALVWIFQDGHLGALGTTPGGTLVADMPVLFCIAFGMSMDYEVFLISRIREYWLGPTRPRPTTTKAWRLGLAHTGRVITAAALIMSISFAALIAAQVSFMRMFGVGLTLAVLADATLVRTLISRPSCTCWAGGTGGHPNRWPGCTSESASANRAPTRHTARNRCQPLLLSRKRVNVSISVSRRRRAWHGSGDQLREGILVHRHRSAAESR